MNFFEIFNKVLLELNYRPVLSFDNIYKSGHRKILEAINRVNTEVLAGYEWPFLERTTILDAVAGENVYELPFKGLIKSIYADRTKVLYTPKAEELLSNRLQGDYYSVSNGKIILPKTAADRVYHLIYYTVNYALGEDGDYKENLSLEGDTSILPMPFAEHILVYGACLKVKANPSYPKFGFWNTMYIQALANLRQKSPQTCESEPFIKIV